MMRRAAMTTAALALLGTAAGAAIGVPRVTVVNITGSTQLTTVETPTYVQDTGTVKGAPVGSGNITLDYRMNPAKGRASVAWVIRNASGTLSGVIRTTYTTTNVSWTFNGVGRITGGTGAYAGIRAYPFQYYAKHSKLGKHEVISIKGTAALPSGT